MKGMGRMREGKREEGIGRGGLEIGGEVDGLDCGEHNQSACFLIKKPRVFV
jgi:hypothetical protein